MKEENGPLIALVVFIVFSLIFGIFAYQDKKELDGNESEHIDSMQKKIDAELAGIEATKEEIKLNNYKIDSFRKGIQAQQERYDFYAQALDEYTGEYTRRLHLKEAAEAYNTQGADLADKVSQKKAATLRAINQETSEVHEKMDAEVAQLTKDTAASAGRKTQIHDDVVADDKKHTNSMNYEKSKLGDNKQTLKDLTEREVERAKVFTEADGKIIYADDIHNILVIDIGSASGVKNGFRFEIYAMRPGARKVSKGYLEVVRADPSKSECKFINRPTLLPKDALSEYVGAQPEELYSPYQQSGNKDSTAQPLAGVAKPTVLGYNLKDPIVEGDLIQNPLFSPDKKYTFYIAGLKEIDKDTGRQKSAIRYRWTEIKQVCEFYGAKVVNDVDIDVNYMICQKDVEADEKFIRGRDLGIPVIYEWELFRFLDNR